MGIHHSPHTHTHGNPHRNPHTHGSPARKFLPFHLLHQRIQYRYTKFAHREVIHVYTITGRVMMFMLQLEVLPYHHHPQQLQQGTPLVQSNGAAQLYVYAVPSAPAGPELYASGQSKVVGIILIIAGVVTLVFHFVAQRFAAGDRDNPIYFGQGIFSGIVVSSCAFRAFFCKIVDVFFTQFNVKLLNLVIWPYWMFINLAAKIA